jgi:hypothetical protein
MDVATPSPAHRQIPVAVRAAGLNPQYAAEVPTTTYRIKKEMLGRVHCLIDVFIA